MERSEQNDEWNHCEIVMGQMIVREEENVQGQVQIFHVVSIHLFNKYY